MKPRPRKAAKPAAPGVVDVMIALHAIADALHDVATAIRDHGAPLAPAPTAPASPTDAGDPKP